MQVDGDDVPVQVGLLGPLVLEVDGRVVDGLPGRERALLAALAVRSGHLTTFADLAEAVWGGSPPDHPRKGLQVLVYRLRRRVGPQVLVTGEDGYTLAVAPEAVDVHRFEAHVAAARAATDPAVTLDHLDRAMDLWRDEPLIDLGDLDRARIERDRLHELRRVAEDERFGARLALGDHLLVAADLEASLAEDPLRERRWAQLMVALHRSGRQADALRAYQRARVALIESLGVEPGPTLRRLEAAVIAHDPVLDRGPSPDERSW